MHPTKVFIRPCGKLGKFLESWILRAVCKKADILHNLEKAGKCAHQKSLASECMLWMGLCYGVSLAELMSSVETEEIPSWPCKPLPVDSSVKCGTRKLKPCFMLRRMPGFVCENLGHKKAV